MSFAEHLAAFRARHPEIEVADVYMTDLNGVARGKLVPAGLLDKLADGGRERRVLLLGSRLPPAATLFIECAIESGLVDCPALVFERLACEVDRESIGVVEAEGVFARKHLLVLAGFVEY